MRRAGSSCTRDSLTNQLETDCSFHLIPADTYHDVGAISRRQTLRSNEVAVKKMRLSEDVGVCCCADGRLQNPVQSGRCGGGRFHGRRGGSFQECLAPLWPTNNRTGRRAACTTLSLDAARPTRAQQQPVQTGCCVFLALRRIFVHLIAVSIFTPTPPPPTAPTPLDFVSCCFRFFPGRRCVTTTTTTTLLYCYCYCF